MASDSEAVNGDVDNDDSSDKMLPTAKLWTLACYKVVRSSSK
jgi:hypothetical protein